MGIQINGNTDIISATDGSLTIQGADLGSVSANPVTIGTGASVSSPATNVLTLGTNSAERIRINSSGAVGVGTNNPVGSIDVITNSSAEALRIRGRSTDNIGTIYFYNNTASTSQGYIQARSTELRIDTDSSNPLTLYSGGSERARIDNTGAATFTKSGFNPITIGGGTGESIFRDASGMSGFHFSASAIYPTNGSGTIVDNTITFGVAGYRWSVIYAGTGTINTSDANLKQDIEDLEQSELNVAVAIKGLVKKFRFTDAVAAKGEDARIHIGVIAQEVEQAFINEGLDPRQYGMFCEDTLEDGSKRLGIRYDELLAFVIAAL